MEKRKNNDKYKEQVLFIRRVSKKTSGGNYVTFSALVAVGDGKGEVGVGIGRSLEVPLAIKKAIAQAKKNVIVVPIVGTTIIHEVMLKYKSSKLLLKPAPLGTGLKVGSVVRVILELAGIENASGKILGTRNQVTNSYATIEALKMFKIRDKS